MDNIASIIYICRLSFRNIFILSSKLFDLPAFLSSFLLSFPPSLLHFNEHLLCVRHSSPCFNKNVTEDRDWDEARRLRQENGDTSYLILFALQER